MTPSNPVDLGRVRTIRHNWASFPAIRRFPAFASVRNPLRNDPDDHRHPRRWHRPGNHGCRPPCAGCHESRPGLRRGRRRPGGLRETWRIAAAGHPGFDPQEQGRTEKPADHAGRRGFQLDQRGASQALRPVRQCAPGQVVPQHQVALSHRRGPDHGAREHRGRLHRRRPERVRGRRNRVVDPEDHPDRFRAHRALCLRPGAQHRPQESHGGAQGQYPQVDIGTVPESGARSGGAIPRDPVQ